MPDVGLPVVDPDGVPVWHLYVVQVPNRDQVLEVLHREGIEAGLHYPTPVHLARAFSWLGHRQGDFPATEAAAGRLLSLPLHPHLTNEQQDAVAGALEQALCGAFVS
jgi:dTDP-4-amino-4,6-dideoxygalactose transaminase